MRTHPFSTCLADGTKKDLAFGRVHFQFVARFDLLRFSSLFQILYVRKSTSVVGLK
jgi:hypothetical protein